MTTHTHNDFSSLLGYVDSVVHPSILTPGCSFDEIILRAHHESSDGDSAWCHILSRLKLVALKCADKEYEVFSPGEVLTKTESATYGRKVLHTFNLFCDNRKPTEYL